MCMVSVSSVEGVDLNTQNKIQQVTILGATGTIGTQTLDVI